MKTRNRNQLIAMTITALAAALISGACSSTNDFCVESAKANCRVQFQCCTAVERSTIFGATNAALGPYASEGACVEVFARQCEVGSQLLDEAINAGRLAFDADKANACVTKRRTAAEGCDANAIFQEDEDCSGLFTGLVADGSACTADNECAEPGSTCEIEQDPSDDGTFVVTLNGICKGQGDAGEPCLPGSRCNDDLRCIFDEDFEQTCLPPQPAGERCGVDDDCESGLRCAFGDDGVSRCIAPGAAGDPCDADADCADGLSCRQNRDFNTVCTELGAENAPCFDDVDCLGGLLCADDGGGNFFEVCQPPAGQGDLCPNGTVQCTPGLDCRFDGVTGENRCTAGIAGDPCGFGQRCAGNLLCRRDVLAGIDRCLAPIAENEDCDFNPDACASGLRCRDENGTFNFTCEDPLPPDAPCSVNNGIDPCDGTHRCEFDGVAGDNICIPREVAGASCFDDDQCTAGLFCDEFNTGTCIGLRNQNQTCDNDTDCAANLSCRANDAGNDTICRALSGNGERCDDSFDCGPGLDCRFDDAGQRQICRGAGVVGERCEGIADCASGLDCRVGADGVDECQDIAGEGGFCENNLDCAPGQNLTCRFDNVTFDQLCIGPADADEPCGVDGDCVEGLVCRFDPEQGISACTELAGIGDTCTSDNDCIVGLRCRDVAEDGNFICTDLQDDFGPCLENDDCLSGFCDLDGEFCTDEPAEVDFEICDGL